MASASETAQEIRDFFEGPAPAPKFDLAGDFAAGQILAMAIRQQTDPKTGDPVFWKSGDPKKQVLLTIQTKEITDEDDGIRTLYVRGEMRKAIAAACLASGDRSPAIGAWVKVIYDGDGPPPARGLNGPKLFKAEYVPAGVSEPPF